MGMAMRLAALAVLAAMLTTLNVSAQSQGVDLSLNRDMVFVGDQDPFGQLTCRAEGNAVNINRVAIIWVKVTGESTELLKVTTETRKNQVSHDGILGNGTLQNNNGFIFLDQMSLAICDSSYFLCEATFTKSSGERERVVATAWPAQPQTGHSGQEATSNDTHALVDLEKRLADMSAAVAMFNMSYQGLLATAQADRMVQATILSRLSKLEKNALTPVQPSQSSCDCENVTNALKDIDNRLEKLEKMEIPTVCERGMSERTSEPFLIMELDSINKQIRCDAQTDGGGWIVIQRRATGDVNFYRNWAEYRDGFGDVNGDFWMGNDAISKLTINDPFEVRVDMTAEGADYYAQYSKFRVLDENSNYQLFVGTFSGTIQERDSRGLTYHNRMEFTTFDRDNDKTDFFQCAEFSYGAFWYDSCVMANINGMWGASNFSGFFWNNGFQIYPLTFVEMKIRQSF